MFLCECELCIYNNECDCTLGDVEISPTGTCGNCEFPTIEESVLIEAKKKAVEEVKEKHAFYEEIKRTFNL